MNARRSHTIWRWILAALCLLYPSLLALLLLSKAVFSPFPLLTLVTSFMPFLFLPVPLLLLIALLTRSRLAAFSNAVLVVIGILLYAPVYLPRAANAEARASRLRVMTFNLGPGQATPQGVAEAIANENADIIAVQELTPATAEALRQQLVYPAMILQPEYESIGLISRYRVIRREWIRPLGQGRLSLNVILDVGGTPVHFLAVHPYPPDIIWLADLPVPVGLDDSEQAKEIANFAATASRLGNYTLVAGDFNGGDSGRGYQAMASVLQDSYREAGSGLGFTFPSELRFGRFPIPGPFIRLDYIFHSPDIQAAEAQVKCLGGSDHCYVVADLILEPK